MLEGRRGLCISNRAKGVNGPLAISVFCYLTKTASATILNADKTAKMAFFNHAKRHHRSVSFQPQQKFSASGSVNRGKDKVWLVRNRTLAVSRTFSHLKPFPAHIRTISRFFALFRTIGASRTILHNFKYKNQ